VLAVRGRAAKIQHRFLSHGRSADNLVHDDVNYCPVVITIRNRAAPLIIRS
jgi:hypothetical protein